MQFGSFLATSSWTIHSILLYLNFFICKMDMTIIVPKNYGEDYIGGKSSWNSVWYKERGSVEVVIPLSSPGLWRSPSSLVTSVCDSPTLFATD